MAAADVLAMVSLVEPLGQVALEALASGRPVVATAVGGAPEVVPTSGPGRVVDPRDPRAIAAALADVLADAPAPAACREAARPHALSLQSSRVEAILARAAAGGARG
jgi:glycosyltransferase involved in cell wall biosynthesis